MSKGFYGATRHQGQTVDNCSKISPSRYAFIDNMKPNGYNYIYGLKGIKRAMFLYVYSGASIGVKSYACSGT